jgi:hypothetical protein
VSKLGFYEKCGYKVIGNEINVGENEKYIYLEKKYD